MRDLFNLSRKAIEVLNKLVDTAENGILLFKTRGHVNNRHLEVLETLANTTPSRI